MITHSLADTMKVEEHLGACASSRSLYEGVADLCTLLREQIRLENEVLFPRFEVEQTRCTCARG